MREGKEVPAYHRYGRRGRQGQTREWKSDFGKSPKKKKKKSNPISGSKRSYVISRKRDPDPKRSSLRPNVRYLA
jgi:hypothetical protein